MSENSQKSMQEGIKETHLDREKSNAIKDLLIKGWDPKRIEELGLASEIEVYQLIYKDMRPFWSQQKIQNQGFLESLAWPPPLMLVVCPSLGLGWKSFGAAARDLGVDRKSLRNAIAKKRKIKGLYLERG